MKGFLIPLNRPGKDKYEVEFVEHGGCRSGFNPDSRHPILYIPIRSMNEFGLPRMIPNVSADLELAVLLRERALQYDNEVLTEQYRRLAQISLRYIKVSIFYMIN
jgi:hypothetical protein